MYKIYIYIYAYKMYKIYNIYIYIYIHIYNIQFYTNLLRTENEMKSVETKYN